MRLLFEIVLSTCCLQVFKKGRCLSLAYLLGILDQIFHGLQLCTSWD